ncbi:MAG: FkbM family methyltransferase [Cyanobacteria bacterium J06627_32]
MNIQDRAKKLVDAARDKASRPQDFYNETKNDRWIVECVYPQKRNGYFVEAGACDGKLGSSCYLLEKTRGWKGICIEPNDSFFEQLLKNRPGSFCENVCLAESAKAVTYIQGTEEADPYLGGIQENLQQFKHDSAGILSRGQAIQKQAKTLASLLKKHDAPSEIDYAAFDIEGSELRVLETFPFDDYQFSALSLECDSYIWDDVTQLLSANGYREVKNPFNLDRPWERYWLHHTMPLSLGA